MIKSITVTNYLDQSLKLELGSPEKSGFLIQEVTGLGPSKATINSTEMSTNDGSAYNSARINSRNIVLNLVFLHTAELTVEDVRQLSYKYFPTRQKLKLMVETDNRLSETYGYVESNEPVIFSQQSFTQLSIICPDPYFYSSGETSINITNFYSVEALFEFVFSNESLTENLIEFGAIIRESEKNIFYAGDAEIGIVMIMHATGSASNVTIYNVRTREQMRIDTDKLRTLTGSGIIAGDDIIISTVKGDKYVMLLRGGVYTNILNVLDKNADWFQLSKGDNIFAYTAEEGDINLQFRIENRTVYEGV